MRTSRVVAHLAIVLLLANALWAQSRPAEQPREDQARRAAATAPAKVLIDVQTDRQDAMYHPGRKATFAITVKREGQPVTAGKVSYALSNDGIGDLGSGQLDLSDKPATVSGTLEKPGMLQCKVTFLDGAETCTGLGAAAYDPLKIRPSISEPKDFDAFWKAQKAALAKIPLDAQLHLDAQRSTDEMKVYQVSLATVDGRRMHAWICTPTAAGKHPAMIVPPANGMNAVELKEVAVWVKEGFVVASCGMLDLPVDKEPEFYKKQTAPDGPYYQWNRGDTLKSRDTIRFRPLILNLVRLTDYVVSRDDWDGKHIVIYGGSFSGGLSLMAAGLDPRISTVWVVAPAFCEMTGWLANRPSCAPRIEKDAEKSAAEIRTFGYYDAVNFARRIHCPTLFSFGLIDSTVPPTTAYSAFNVLPARDKEVFTVPRKGHRSGQAEYWDNGYEFVMKHVGRPKKAS